MKSLTAYRIISYILLPIAGLFGIASLFFLLIAVALLNLNLLIQVMILAASVVYVILSFILLNKVLENNKKNKPSLIKWIRITASISLIFCFSSMFESISLLYSPLKLSQGINLMEEMGNKLGSSASTENLLSMYKGALYFMTLYCTTLLIHIYETKKLIRHYFKNQPPIILRIINWYIYINEMEDL